MSVEGILAKIRNFVEDGKGSLIKFLEISKFLAMKLLHEEMSNLSAQSRLPHP